MTDDVEVELRPPDVTEVEVGCKNALAVVKRAGQAGKSQEFYQKSVDTLEDLLKSTPGNTRVQSDLADCCNNFQCPIDAGALNNTLAWQVDADTCTAGDDVWRLEQTFDFRRRVVVHQSDSHHAIGFQSQARREFERVIVSIPNIDALLSQFTS